MAKCSGGAGFSGVLIILTANTGVGENNGCV